MNFYSTLKYYFLTNINFSEIVKGMKVDRQAKSPEHKSRSSQVRAILDGVKSQAFSNNEKQRTRVKPQTQTDPM